MFGKQEAAQLRKEFWTVFGKYMQPVPSVNGENCNWINYKTGVKNIRFHMQADELSTVVAIELDHIDSKLRESVKHKFLLLTDELQQLPYLWKWKKDENRNMDVFITELPAVHILRKSDWPQIISFLKRAIVALDLFWWNNKFIFES